jgi:hypothetical protein
VVVLQRRWCDALTAAGGGLWLYLNFLEQVQKVGCSIALSLAEFMLPPAIFGGPVGLYLSRTHGVIVFMPTFF